MERGGEVKHHPVDEFLDIKLVDHRVKDEVVIFSARITDRFSIGTAPVGGMLLALMIKAGKNGLRLIAPTGKGSGTPSSEQLLQQEGQYPHPVSATIHFMQRSQAGEALLRVSVVNRAKRNAHVTVALLQDGKTVLHLVAIFGNLLKRDRTLWNVRNMDPPKGLFADPTTVPVYSAPMQPVSYTHLTLPTNREV